MLGGTQTLGRFNEYTTPGLSLSDAGGSTITSKEYALNLLKQMDKKTVIPTNIYKEIVRFLINQFNNSTYMNNEMETISVKCRYGNPERTIARLKEHDNAILPLLTISQNTIIESPERRKIASLLLNETIWNDEKQRAERVISYCDRPVTIQYNLNIWAKYMEDMDQLAQTVRLAFNPALTLHTNFSKDSQALLDSEVNNYSFALGDREDRILRKSLTISVETYIRSPKFKITSTGEIETVHVEADILS